MTIFLVILLIVFAAVVKRRLDEIEWRLGARIEDIETGEGGSRELVEKLAERVARLEAAVSVQPSTGSASPQPASRSAVEQPVFIPATGASSQPVSPGPVPSSVTPSVVVAATSSVPPTPAAVKEVATLIAPPPVRSTPIPVQLSPDTGPSLMSRVERRIRDELQREEWEAVVGASWLNKLGVLVLVIGIALFLGYSFAQLGAAGRVTLGFAASGTLIAAGVAFERKPRYSLFSRGLIGGGWAGLYFTTYAMHALEPARVLANALAASVALVLVAAGMIVQSLRYRSQVVTGLAYFIGFITLAITPAASFSLVATVPLAASLLVVAQRFAWAPMAAVGLAATYGTYLFTGAGAPAGSIQQFARESIMLAVIWLLFEGFDLFYRHGGRGFRSDRFLFPLNACGFVGTSLLRWSTFTPEMLYVFLGIAAAAYLMSAVARALAGRVAAPSVEEDPLSAFTGSHRASLTVAVALVTPALLLRFSGIQLNVAFLVVAELLFLSALQFGDPYMRWLAGFVLAVPVLKSFIVDPRLTGDLVVGTWTWLPWTPAAALTATILYANRALLRRRAPIGPELGYRAAASSLLMLIIGSETPQPYMSVAWFLLGLAFFELGLRKGLEEFRSHAYVVGAVALAMIAVRNFEAIIQEGGWPEPAIAAALAYTAVARLELSPRGVLSASERRHVSWICSWSGTVYLTTLIWTGTPAPHVGSAWLILALLLFELGLRRRLRGALPQAYVVGSLGLVAVALVDVVLPVVLLGANVSGPDERTGGALISAVFARALFRLGLWDGLSNFWPPLALATLLVMAASVRQYFSPVERLRLSERERVKWISSWAGTVFVAALVWHLVPRPGLGVAWLLLAMGLFEIAIRLGRADWRSQAYAVGVLAMRTLLIDAFPNTVDAWYLIGVVGSGSVLAFVVFLRAFWLFPGRMPEVQQAAVRDASAAFGTALAGILIWQLMPVSLVAIGWALIGVALLNLGFALSLGSLRLYAHGLFALIVGRLFLVNLTGMGAMLGISPRVLTVVPIVAVFYVLSTWLRRETTKPWERGVPRLYAITATVLLAKLLFDETSAARLTVAWAIQGTALLAAGFAVGSHVLRRLGLILLAVCTIKAFGYDFRRLDTFSRIVSFVVLGTLLLIASWVYTRFRERLSGYL